MFLHFQALFLFQVINLAVLDKTFHPPWSGSQTESWRFTAAATTTTTTTVMSTPARPISKKILSVEQAEGVGAQVRRSVGRPEVRMSPTHA